MRRTGLIALLSLLVLLSLSLSIPAFANPIAPESVDPIALAASVTLSPVADAHVNSAYPNNNYGSANGLLIDYTPTKRVYLRFNVTGLSGTVTKATLRLYATNSLSAGAVNVKRVDVNTWSESGITFNNRPGFGASITTLGAATAGQWVTADVTSFVTGNGTYSFGLGTQTTTAQLGVSSRETANKPQLVIQTGSTTMPTPTPTLFQATLPAPTRVPPTATATRVPPTATPIPSGNEMVLCDGKTLDGPSTIVVNDTNASVRKVIRNCRFINTASKSLNSPAIQIRAVDNLLIENSTFDNLRTFQPGNDFVAIKFDNVNGAVAKNVVIRGNRFDRIGSDGVQIGKNSFKTSNVTIEGNEFIGHDGIGENAIDIKVADGGIVIRNNSVHGFRPCNSPKRGGNQDCSGSPGEGITLHTASAGNPPSALHGVLITGNQIFNNTIGLVVSGAVDITVTGNVFSGNLRSNMSISNCTNCSIQK